MLGKNFVTLRGTVSRPQFKVVGQFNTSLFKGSIAIPTANGKNQYIKVAAWSEIADSLKDVDPSATIEVQGHIEESSYEAKCRHCSGPDKKYWTEVVIDNFVVVEEEIM